MTENSKHSKMIEVKKITGYGLIFCLRALKATEWDIQKAVVFLKDNPPVALKKRVWEKEDTICPVCGEYSFEFPDDYDNCRICGWENDGLQRADKDYWGGANSFSVNESKLVFLLSRNDIAKNKLTEILEKYNLKRGEIHFQYPINDTTIEGQKYFNALTQVHNDFIKELNELKEMCNI